MIIIIIIIVFVVFWYVPPRLWLLALEFMQHMAFTSYHIAHFATTVSNSKSAIFFKRSF
jgi:hypothetical protein